MAKGMDAGKGRELVPINQSTILSKCNTHLFNGPHTCDRQFVSISDKTDNKTKGHFS